MEGSCNTMQGISDAVTHESPKVHHGLIWCFCLVTERFRYSVPQIRWDDGHYAGLVALWWHGGMMAVAPGKPP